MTHATRFIDVLEVSGKSKREHTPTETGVEKISRNGIDITFQIPIYDFGEARTRLAEETYLKSVNLLIDKAVNVRADARQAYQAYRGSYDIARYYDTEILPLREIISEQNSPQLQRHAFRSVRPSYRCPLARFGQREGDRGQARFLAREC